MDNQTDNYNSKDIKPLVSIVIPVYNVADYLVECMDSVVNQTYDNLEIICVNDGSTDSSGDILKQYQSNDSRIQILTQDNQGVGVARNNGMDRATGKYIIFWDSDDYFNLNAIELMVTQAEMHHADLCVCDAQDFFSDTGEKIAHRYVVTPYPDSDTFSWKDCPDWIFIIPGGVIWNKLVLLSLLREHDIRFPDWSHLEDSAYMPLLVCYAERITICNKKLIHYRMNRPDSLVQSNESGSENVVTVYRKVFDELNQRNLLIDPLLRNGFLFKVASMYQYRIRYCSSFNEYTAIYNKFFSQESPLSEYSSSNGIVALIEDLKSLSAGDFLLQYYKKQQRINDLKQQTIRESKRNVRNLKSTIEKKEEKNHKLTKKNDQLKTEINQLKNKNEQLKNKNEQLKNKNEQLKEKIAALKDTITQIRSSHSFKIGKAITSPARLIKK